MKPFMQRRTMLQGKSRECVCALKVEFAAHVGAVVLHCPVMNGERIAYFLTGKTVRDQAQDFFLGRREFVEFE